MLEINVMKANAIVATLLIAAAVHAGAHFASPYPRKAIAPDESAGWIVINGNAWTHSARSESDRRRSIVKEASKDSSRTGLFHSASPASAP